MMLGRSVWEYWSRSWQSVKSTTITNYFHHARFYMQDDTVEESASEEK